jgi:hypothetical protein
MCTLFASEAPPQRCVPVVGAVQEVSRERAAARITANWPVRVPAPYRRQQGASGREHQHAEHDESHCLLAHDAPASSNGSWSRDIHIVAKRVLRQSRSETSLDGGVRVPKVAKSHFRSRKVNLRRRTLWISDACADAHGILH